MFGKTDKTKLSIGNSRSVCGYTIKKMPIGAYLTAIEKLKDLPGDFMQTCFPDQSFMEILDSLTSVKGDGIATLAGGAFMSAPRYIVGFVSELTGISEENLLNDENIGLDGFVEIINAFIDVNGLGEFLSAVAVLKTKIKELIR